MSNTVTHITGKHACGHARDGDTESARPQDVSCLRCRHAIGARAAEILGSERVVWVAKVWGWIPLRRAA